MLGRLHYKPVPNEYHMLEIKPTYPLIKNTTLLNLARDDWLVFYSPHIALVGLK